MARFYTFINVFLYIQKAFFMKNDDKMIEKDKTKKSNKDDQEKKDFDDSDQQNKIKTSEKDKENISGSSDDTKEEETNEENTCPEDILKELHDAGVKFDQITIEDLIGLKKGTTTVKEVIDCIKKGEPSITEAENELIDKLRNDSTVKRILADGRKITIEPAEASNSNSIDDLLDQEEVEEPVHFNHSNELVNDNGNVIEGINGPLVRDDIIANGIMQTENGELVNIGIDGQPILRHNEIGLEHHLRNLSQTNLLDEPDARMKDVEKMAAKLNENHNSPNKPLNDTENPKSNDENIPNSALKELDDENNPIEHKKFNYDQDKPKGKNKDKFTDKKDNKKSDDKGSSNKDEKNEDQQKKSKDHKDKNETKSDDEDDEENSKSCKKSKDRKKDNDSDSDCDSKEITKNNSKDEKKEKNDKDKDDEKKQNKEKDDDKKHDKENSDKDNKTNTEKETKPEKKNY
ncbi:hypothetical protein EDEG_02943 [Edhazardia aedis USNM 41457]|uniref:Uncharacterized protein n=1 Tax=Edhazardia aedis (strain USNM 41457) TaxID=1003232 RepID=J9DJ83_EDHAE|nr:hypothetical protein EDEG_02943 [Edhazardia aedis USNM 41457]|eukprot:EJW02660.1 hypothetical protein EDEG_02943 [Edhazardia aedis USNM 41457]